MGKTQILSAKEAEGHFLFKENLYLTKLHERAKQLSSIAAKRKLAKKVAAEFRLHIKKCKGRNKDKITKRYLSLLGALGFPFALAEAKEIYLQDSGLRVSVLNFLQRLPFGKRVSNAFLQLLMETIFYDDVSRFAFTESLVKWRIPYDNSGRIFVRAIVKQLKKSNSAFDWFCHLFFLSKYGKPHEILNEFENGKNLFFKEPFFARQGTSALPRGLAINPKTVERHWEYTISAGANEAASVASNFVRFYEDGFPKKSDNAYFYLFPKNPQNPYPIAKFLLLCVIAAGDSRQNRTSKRPEVTKHITDPWYKHWLKQIHPHWF